MTHIKVFNENPINLHLSLTFDAYSSKNIFCLGVYTQYFLMYFYNVGETSTIQCHTYFQTHTYYKNYEKKIAQKY